MAKPKLLKRDGSLCPYCHRTMDVTDLKLKPTNDHIKAKSKGLSVHRINPVSKKIKTYGRTIVVCSECNFMKGHLSLTEFLASLADKNKILLEAVATNEERIRNIQYLLQIGLDKE